MSHYKPYPAYKDSGVEWLGQVPEHWQVKRLRFAAMLNPPIRPDLLADLACEVSFLPMEAIGEDGSLNLEQNRPVQDVRNGYSYFEDGDVAFAKVTPCFENGKGALMQGLQYAAGFGTTELTVMRPVQDVTDARHLSYIVQSTQFRTLGAAAMTGAGGLKRVPDEFTRNFPVAFPPRTERELIGDHLDRETARIDALVAKKTRFIELLREKRQALITHAVTKGLDPNVTMKDSGVEWLGEVPEHWDVKAIRWLSPVQRGASPRPIDDPVYFDDDGEYGWVRIEDVTASDGFLEETKQRLSALGSSLSVKLSPGALFLSIAGSVGKPCITRIKACIHDGFVYFPLLKTDPMWLVRIFESRSPFVGLGKLGTQLNLNTETVGSIKVALPPAGEISEILSDLDRCLAHLGQLISRTEHSITLLKERRSALITAAVTGQIDLREAV
ncbi:restriction endonuclease subunit S [Pseudomonas aeruginosa]|uniref:restriction endonuclease subunit S n=1 Tax=Pseudomonas aeruginosa TaxID=287 RepID=UPI000D529932|nr:restriction endonuclease subunit S [Pseudomonas aeruginosa]AWE97786.1 putative type I restriction enzyme, S subunit [Pseudomonas aeruginosa]HBP6555341.1 restriction endonuclease subunit S [Pseudomonas aeruginosa]